MKEKSLRFGQQSVFKEPDNYTYISEEETTNAHKNVSLQAGDDYK